MKNIFNAGLALFALAQAMNHMFAVNTEAVCFISGFSSALILCGAVRSIILKWKSTSVQGETS